MVSVVSSSPTGGNFLYTSMLILYKNVRFVLFTKTSNESPKFMIKISALLPPTTDALFKKRNLVFRFTLHFCLEKRCKDIFYHGKNTTYLLIPNFLYFKLYDINSIVLFAVCANKHPVNMLLVVHFRECAISLHKWSCLVTLDWWQLFWRGYLSF